MCSRAEVVIRLGANPKHPQWRSSASMSSSAQCSHVPQAAEDIWILLCVMHGISAVTTLFQEHETNSSRMSNAQEKQIWSLQWISAPAVCDTFSQETYQHVRHFQLLFNTPEAKPLKPQMDLLFASPFRPINDTVYELTNMIHHTKPP